MAMYNWSYPYIYPSSEITGHLVCTIECPTKQLSPERKKHFLVGAGKDAFNLVHQTSKVKSRGM